MTNQDPNAPVQLLGNNGDKSSTTARDAKQERDAQRDPLLVCLALVANLLDRKVHLPALRAGFAVDSTGRIPVAAFPDLARQHGMIAAWSRTRPTAIPSYVLPAIVPFVDGRAVVLVAIQANSVKLLAPESGMTELSMSTEEIEALSTGEVLVVKAAPEKGSQQMVAFKGDAFNWFWGTLWRFRAYYVESMIATVVANILTLASIFFTMNVYNKVVPSHAYASLWALAIGTTLAILFEYLMRWLKARLVDLGGKKADLAINATLLREIMSIRLENRPQSIGIFASSMRDFEALRDFFSSASLVLLADMPFIILFLWVIGVVGGPIVVIPLLAVIVLSAIGWFAQRPLTSATRANMKESGDRQSVLVESVLNLELLKAHNAQGYLQRRWENANLAAADSYKASRALTNGVMGLTSTASQLVTVGMVVYGVYLIHDGGLTLGALIAAVMLAGRVITPLAGVMSLATRYQQAMGALSTLDGLMKRPRDRDSTRKYIVPDRFVGKLQADAVEFAYPSENKIPVLRRVSFTLPAGSRLGLLGKVGSGKSTLLRVMSGLYTPLGGNVLVDDMDIRQIEPAELRSRIGYVGQDAQLFMGTLRENLVLSDTWISDEKILATLELLGISSMVQAHPRGLDMSLTEAGGGLSGGQRQLLTVARMMLRDPTFIFMDEPTSHMDQATEKRVIQVLAEWLKGRTLMLSTHRPQLLVWVDRLLVLDRGRVLLEGPRDEVLAKVGRGVPTQQGQQAGGAGAKTPGTAVATQTAAAPGQQSAQRPAAGQTINPTLGSPNVAPKGDQS